MKVAIIGNMNNNANNLAKYLLDAGVDCQVVFYNNEAEHFNPQADNITGENYHSKTVSWGDYQTYFTTSASQIRKDLAEYDFIIGSRLAPAFCAKAGILLDIFMPTGGDLHTLPVWNGWEPRDLVKYVFFSRIQRKAIEKVGTLFWDVTNDEIETTIAPFTKNLDRMIHAIPTIYHPEYQGGMLEIRQEMSDVLNQFRKIRQNADIFLVSHVKHVWIPKTIAIYGKFHEKGNDQIILALARYYEGNPSKKLMIALFEYGLDHGATRELAKSLNVDQYITWFPILPRREIMLGIAESDGVIGEIARSWFSYGTIMEAMVMKKAVLHNRNDALYPDSDLYPMVHVDNADSLHTAFVAIKNGTLDLEKIGREANNWFINTNVLPTINDILERIEIKRTKLKTA